MSSIIVAHWGRISYHVDHFMMQPVNKRRSSVKAYSVGAIVMPGLHDRNAERLNSGIKNPTRFFD